MTDNQNWLAEYVQTGSDAAFCELVSRYVDLVYSTALRLVGDDRHRAQDVTQTVFINLARVARTLPKDVKLGGWLHRDTCFTASTLMRGERRRQSRERQAAEMNALQNNSAADYSRVAPVLDDAINELGDEDRTAILLRFFEQQDFHSVGQALSSTEDAARMRVTRALEKLESFLKRRGITTTAASLSVVLSANAVQAAPVGLALTISTAAALTGTTLATSATITATKAIAMTALQKTIITATIAVLAGAGIYEARQAAHLRDQVLTLQQRQAEQIAQLDKALIDSTNQMAALRDDNERLNRNTSDLLRLRGEVSKLRAQLVQKAKPDTTTALQAALAEQPIDELEQQRQAGIRKQQTIAKMGYGRNWLLAFLQYAQQNNGQLPTSFDQSVAFLPEAARDETILATNQFEIVAQGSISALTNAGAVIVIRELHAQQVNGGWVKTYIFADGHSEVRKETDGNFETWEDQHMLPPVAPNR